MGRHALEKLSGAQQQILDGCDTGDGVFTIPPFRVQQSRSARILESKGYVDIKRVNGGTLEVTRKNPRRAS